MIPSPGIQKRHLQGLLVGVCVLALCNVSYYVFDKPFYMVSRFIYLGSDTNIAAWYSSILLALAAMAAASSYRVAKSRGLPNPSRFLLASLLLWLMSCDEIAQFHEIIGEIAARAGGFRDKPFAANAPWVWVLGPAVIAVFVFVAALTRRAMAAVPRTWILFVVGLATIVAGGVVLESTINFLNEGEFLWLWRAEIIIEETLEMLGTLLVAYSFVRWKDAVAASPGTPGNGAPRA